MLFLRRLDVTVPPCLAYPWKHSAISTSPRCDGSSMPCLPLKAQYYFYVARCAIAVTVPPCLSYPWKHNAVSMWPRCDSSSKPPLPLKAQCYFYVARCAIAVTVPPCLPHRWRSWRRPAWPTAPRCARLASRARPSASTSSRRTASSGTGPLRLPATTTPFSFAANKWTRGLFRSRYYLVRLEELMIRESRIGKQWS